MGEYTAANAPPGPLHTTHTQERRCALVAQHGKRHNRAAGCGAPENVPLPQCETRARAAVATVAATPNAPDAPDARHARGTYTARDAQ